MSSASDRWRVEPGKKVRLDRIDPHSKDGAPGADRAVTEAATAELNGRLAVLQERLWAEGKQSLLVVLQAMDAGGKDGTVKHVFRNVNPSGVHVTGFKSPTETELAHDFLWRIHRRTPLKGDIGVFNRSHYEDVLIVRVAGLAPESVWRPRFRAIRDFERHLLAEGTTIVKLFLHISKEEQAERLQARLDDPSKHWKFRRADLDVRSQWDDYQEAYAEAIEETAKDDAPWFVVPADRKWYRNWVVSTILVDALERMDPQFPPSPDDITGLRVV